MPLGMQVRQAATAMQRAAVRTAHALAAVVRKIVAAASLKIWGVSRSSLSQF